MSDEQDGIGGKPAEGVSTIVTDGKLYAPQWALDEIERLRAALYDAREYVAYKVDKTSEVWAIDRLAKIDAALGHQQDQHKGEK